ncbi:MAG: AAA family ATPase [Casimicrobiaceae bacterium]
MNVETEFCAALRAHGLNPPPEIIADGKLRRFAGNGKPNDDSAWYVLHADKIPAGAFGDWRSGASGTWRAKLDRPLSFVEAAAQEERVAAMQAQRDADAARRQVNSSNNAERIWSTGQSAPAEHPYLVRKGVASHGLRQYFGPLVINGMACDGALMVPLRDSGGVLRSLQFIDANEKRFLPGGKVSSCYFAIGKPNGEICLVEGYASGASVHESVGHAVAVAFSAGNLEAVARELRRKYTEEPFIVCADDDYRTPGNPGRTKATEAARAIGGLVAVPDFGDTRPEQGTDFNDLMLHVGAEAVIRCVANARAPDVVEHQPETQNATADDLDGRDVLLIRGDTITPEPISWLWDGWLAAGKFHVLAGQPGTGKTTLALAFAATVSAGGRWPDGTRAERGSVILWSAEDDVADTLVPRLLAMGADLSRVQFVGAVREGIDARPFDPAHDVPALVRAAEQVGGARLLIVDPVVSAVAGDSHKNAETRRSLQPLVDLATRLGCAVLGISHFTKGTSGREPIERVTGSLAFGAVARVVLVAAKLPEDRPEGGPARLLARAKSNIAADTGGFGYDLDFPPLDHFPGISTARVLWGAAIQGTARDLLAQAEQEPSDQQSEQTEAANWLRGRLADAGGEMERREVMSDAKAAGFAERTVDRAKATAGVRVQQSGFGKDKRSVWRIDETPIPPQSRHSRQAQSVGGDGANGGGNGESEVF